MSQVKTVTLFTDKTATGVSAVIEPWGTRRTVTATITGSGAVSATLVVQVSNDGTNFATLQSLSLSGTDADIKIHATDAAYRYMRLDLSAISGTSAAVTAIIGSHNG